MRQVFALAAAALVVIAGSQFISSVSAKSNLSISRRVAILETKVKGLQSANTKLTKAVTILAGDQACLSARGFTIYGNPTGAPASGYYFSNDGGATSFFTTGVDETALGDTVTDYVATVAPSCVHSVKAASGYRMMPLRHRPMREVLRPAH